MTSNPEPEDVFPLPAAEVFEWNYYDRLHRVKINQGGTSSGKTYSILQVLALRLLEQKRICTVVGQDIPNLRKGSYRDFLDRIVATSSVLDGQILKHNRTTLSFEFANGSILEFTSYKDEQDAKNGKRDIAFFNEANGIPYAIYRQVAMRTTEEVFIDYNPTAPFWAHEHLMGRPDVVTFYSNFTHNPYVSEGTLIELRDIKAKDDQLWQVYGLGKTGELGELVIPKITVVPTMPAALANRGYGLDFGYRADPTALVECGLQNGGQDLYVDQLVYKRGMDFPAMDRAFAAAGASKRMYYHADGADARACDDLRARGYPIREAKKGPGSIEYGIGLINQCNVFVTERSVDLIQEQKKYTYKKQKSGPRAGELTNQPVDAYNHGLDALRYWALANVRPRKVVQQGLRGYAV